MSTRTRHRPARPISLLPVFTPPKPKYRFEVLTAAAFRELAGRPKQAQCWRRFGEHLAANDNVWAIIRSLDEHIMCASEPCHVEGKTRHYAEIVLAGIRMIPAIVY